MKAMDTRLRARRAPFGFPAEGALGPGKSRLLSKVNAIYRNRHQEDLSHRCRGRHRGSPASVLQSQAQETSSAADPATVFDRVNRFPSHPQIISDRLSPFANNVLPFALNLRGAAHIRK